MNKNALTFQPDISKSPVKKLSSALMVDQTDNSITTKTKRPTTAKMQEFPSTARSAKSKPLTGKTSSMKQSQMMPAATTEPTFFVDNSSPKITKAAKQESSDQKIVNTTPRTLTKPPAKDKIDPEQEKHLNNDSFGKDSILNLRTENMFEKHSFPQTPIAEIEPVSINKPDVPNPSPDLILTEKKDVQHSFTDPSPAFQDPSASTVPATSHFTEVIVPQPKPREQVLVLDVNHGRG